MLKTRGFTPALQVANVTFAFGPTGLLESVVGIAAATAPTGGAVS